MRHLLIACALFTMTSPAMAQMTVLRDDPEAQRLMDDYSALTVAYFVNEACDVLSSGETSTLRRIVEDATQAMDSLLDERVGARHSQALMIGLQRDSYSQAQSRYGSCDSLARDFVTANLSGAQSFLASLPR